MMAWRRRVCSWPQSRLRSLAPPQIMAPHALLVGETGSILFEKAADDLGSVGEPRKLTVNVVFDQLPARQHRLDDSTSSASRPVAEGRGRRRTARPCMRR
jgi:hypothetical protein